MIFLQIPNRSVAAPIGLYFNKRIKPVYNKCFSENRVCSNTLDRSVAKAAVPVMLTQTGLDSSMWIQTGVDGANISTFGYRPV